jgi:hypothetical protein
MGVIVMNKRVDTKVVIGHHELNWSVGDPGNWVVDVDKSTACSLTHIGTGQIVEDADEAEAYLLEIIRTGETVEDTWEWNMSYTAETTVDALAVATLLVLHWN